MNLSEAIDRLTMTSSDQEIAGVIDAFSRSQVDPVLVSRFAQRLADSGDRVAPVRPLSVDVASTGAPSSLSTLVTPLYCVGFGAIVPKLGVPGRPAGGIDCLAQLPGYRSSLTASEISSVLERCNYAHFLAQDAVAPLDGRVFSLRKKLGAQKVPCLVVASILAKKIAVGVHRVVLDIRVAPWGNFGGDSAVAASNAKIFRVAARALGIEAFTVLTDGRYPYQPFIGRAEALVALHRIVTDRATELLALHASTCCSLAGLATNTGTPLPPCDARTLRSILESHLKAQGSSGGILDDFAERTMKAHSRVLCAGESGFFAPHLGSIRTELTRAQEALRTPNRPFPDPIGAILLRKAGEWVNRGDPLCSIRIEKEALPASVLALPALFTSVSNRPFGFGMESVDDE